MFIFNVSLLPNLSVERKGSSKEVVCKRRKEKENER
jgi:hypothetical protein